MLHACFTQLQIMLNIHLMTSSAVTRFSLGQPIIFTKGVRGNENATKLQQTIGNPTTQKWMMVPSENVLKIESFGINNSMLDLPSLNDMMIDQICAMSGIPRPVLMGTTAGIVSGSEVNERQYYGVLDRMHHKINELIREFNKLDPWLLRLFKQYGITRYEINWGLRQVLTKQQQADLDSRNLQNAISEMNFKTLDEIRTTTLGLPDMEHSSMDEDTCIS